jgi:hypothetical protein
MWKTEFLKGGGLFPLVCQTQAILFDTDVLSVIGDRDQGNVPGNGPRRTLAPRG